MGLRPELFVLGTIAVVACARQPTFTVVVRPPAAEAISHLGDTLWNLPIDPALGPVLVTELQEAREQAAESPLQLGPLLRLGARNQAVGRLREAVQVYTTAAELHFRDPRVFLHRGTTLLRLRQTDAAIDDLQRAARLSLERPNLVEMWAIPSGGYLQTAVAYRIRFGLGLAHFFNGAFPAARRMFVEAIEHASGPDEVVELALWLYYTSTRLGLAEDARNVVAAIRPDMPVDLSRGEHRMLLAFQGRVSADSLATQALQPTAGDERAVWAFGIGHALLVGGRTDDAVLWFQQARRVRNWSSWSYLAAEAELARLAR